VSGADVAEGEVTLRNYSVKGLQAESIENHWDLLSLRFAQFQTLALDPIGTAPASASIAALYLSPRHYERLVFLDGPLTLSENGELSYGTTFFHPELRCS
jgi:hypothetical protein